MSGAAAGSLSALVNSLRGVGAALPTLFELSFEDRVARLTMRRAASRNAIAEEDWRALPSLVEQAGRLGARAILLESTVEGVFSAGYELRELAGLLPDPSSRLPFRNAVRAAIDAVRASRVPVIACIDGECLNVAVALVAACDVRVAGSRARFSLSAARLGIGIPLEDIARLRSLVGDGQAARLMLSAETIGADEARRIGLAEIGGGEQSARALARAIADNAAGSVAMIKSGLLAAAGQASGEGHDRAFDALLGGADFGEGVAAARAGRAPHY